MISSKSLSPVSVYHQLYIAGKYVVSSKLQVWFRMT